MTDAVWIAIILGAMPMIITELYQIFGKKEFYGEYLINAQGEDVVAGVRTPQPIINLKKDKPKVFKQLV